MGRQTDGQIKKMTSSPKLEDLMEVTSLLKLENQCRMKNIFGMGNRWEENIVYLLVVVNNNKNNPSSHHFITSIYPYVELISPWSCF
jgi:hypothetical protein